MSIPIDLLIMRHAKSELNLALEKSRKGDHSYFVQRFLEAHTSHLPLCKQGRGEAMQAGAWIQREFGYFDRYITSPYIRTVETSGLLGFKDAHWEKNIYLTERDWGTLEIVSYEQGNARSAHDYEADRERAPLFWRTPNGERLIDLCLRVDIGLNNIFQQSTSNSTIIVTHGEVMRAMQMKLEQLSFEEFIRRENSEDPADAIWNCEIMHYTRRCPKTSNIGNKLRWVRHIRPTENPVHITPWKEIQKTTYSSEELLEQVAQYRHYFE